MDLLTISQIGISAFGSAAFLLVTSETTRAQKIGVILGLASNPFWWGMVIATEQWVTIPVHLLDTYGWLRKAKALRSHQQSIKSPSRGIRMAGNTHEPQNT